MREENSSNRPCLLPRFRINALEFTCLSVKFKRSAAHSRTAMLIASGKAAIWHGAVFTCTASANVLPPRAPGPIPVAFTISSSSFSSSAVRSSFAEEPTGRKSADFAMPATLSNVPPMPTPITSGGHAFAALWRTQSMTSLRMPCLPAPGGSITTREALSDPPPFNSTCNLHPAFSLK